MGGIAGVWWWCELNMGVLLTIYVAVAVPSRPWRRLVLPSAQCAGQGQSESNRSTSVTTLTRSDIYAALVSPSCSADLFPPLRFWEGVVLRPCSIQP